jgi:regulator of sirC expression with transglutaminase-like and TPR domain
MATILDDVPYFLAQELQQLGALPDNKLPYAKTALALSATIDCARPLAAFENHLLQLHDAARLSMADTRPQTVAEQVAVLQQVVVDEFGYKPDLVGFDDVANIDFCRVIERRQGIPVALGLIYLDVAKALGWHWVGLNFPAHFLVRAEVNGQQLIFDPYHNEVLPDAVSLRRLLKKVAGDEAELNHHYYQPVTAREVVLRFANNRKMRLIKAENYEEALAWVQVLGWVAPTDRRLMYDQGIIAGKLGYLQMAIDALLQFSQDNPNGREVMEAKELIAALRHTLN